MDVISKPIELVALLLLLLCTQLVGLQLRKGRDSSTGFHCIEEQDALHDFKSGMDDRSNHLSSWTVEDDECCQWRGVRCNNRTGRVERLLLRGPQDFNARRRDSSTSFRCIEEERDALLDFKLGLDDPGNLLSSWVKENDDCCQWRGVRCDNRTGRVDRLLLRAPQHLFGNSIKMLRGEIRPSLLDLTHLKHLDLSHNNFSAMIGIPVFLGSFKELRYLNLSKAGFNGRVPPELGNLSTLKHLDLSDGHYYVISGVYNNLEVEDTRWLSRLTSLQHLDMSAATFQKASSSNWLHALNMLPSIIEIRLSNCGLDGPFPSFLPRNNFTSLSILDLSWNFIYSTIPESLYNLASLSYIDLSYNQLYGLIPAALGNLTSLPQHNIFTSLSILDLSWNNINSTIPEWLYNLASLSYLDLSYNQLYGLIPVALGNLTSLPHQNIFTSLSILDLSWNNINSTIPESLCNLTSLSYLDLMFNKFDGPIPAALGNMTSLEYLGLSFTGYIHAREISKSLANLCNLSTFGLSGLGVSGYMNDLQEVLSGCMTNNLNTLELSGTNLTGSIPASLGNLVSLQSLDLGGNKLTGFIPASLGNLVSLQSLNLTQNTLTGSIPASLLGNLVLIQKLVLSANKLTGNISKRLGRLSNLIHLDLGWNNLEGILGDEHFVNLAKLKFIDISGNPSLALKVSTGWNPPFRLDYIYMRSCILGPQFPAWLRTQENYIRLAMSNATISDTIPDWFWNLSTQFDWLAISHNMISGKLQSLTSEQAYYLDLSDNLFSGPIPPTIWDAMPNLEFLDLSMNHINGTIPLSVCKSTEQVTINLSNNFISGELPNCWENTSGLQVMDISNNNLSGELPFALSNCTQLVLLDLSHNRFNGSIPPEIGQSLSYLTILSLHSNMLSGTIPSQLSNLSALQILDLSHNQLSGFIPQSFGDFPAMKSNHINSYTWIRNESVYYGFKYSLMLNMKGRELSYDSRLLPIVVAIDLSDNSLSGSIPKEVGNLIGMDSLNLSENQLSGEIINEIGELRQLETLDLSKNKLSGRIPASLSDIYTLSHLNLSYNNLTGRIPSGEQLQTLNDPSTYIGNDDLCGPPLIKKCLGDETPPTIGDGFSIDEETEESDDIIWIYSGMAPGYVVGLLAFFGLLALKRKWRIAYFRFIDYIYDTIYMAITININKLKRGMPKISNHGLARIN